MPAPAARLLTSDQIVEQTQERHRQDIRERWPGAGAEHVRVPELVDQRERDERHECRGDDAYPGRERELSAAVVLPYEPLAPEALHRGRHDSDRHPQGDQERQ